MANHMKRAILICWWSAWLLVPFVILLPFVPVFPGMATYEGTGSAHGQRIGRRSSSGQFLLVEGRLYLLRQQTWHGLFLTTCVRRVTWNEDKLRELRQRFPEVVIGDKFQ
jgi:hypothetical protein